MNFNDASQYLAQRFAAGWGIATPIIWPNTEQQIPNTAWVRYNNNPVTSVVGSLGIGAKMRRIGRVTIQVFTPIKTGDGVGILLAQAALDIFEQQDFNGIHIFECWINDLGDDGFGWYQHNVVIPYYAQ